MLPRALRELVCIYVYSSTPVTPDSRRDLKTQPVRMGSSMGWCLLMKGCVPAHTSRGRRTAPRRQEQRRGARSPALEQALHSGLGSATHQL